MSVWLWILIVVAAVVLTAVVTTWLVRKQDTRKVSFMMDSLEDGEMNFRFRDNSNLNRALNRIRGIFTRRTAVDEAASWSKLFRVMTPFNLFEHPSDKCMCLFVTYSNSEIIFVSK